MTDLKVDNFPKRHIIVYVYCLAGDLIGYIIALLMYVIFGEKLIWENGLWCAVPDASIWCRKIAKGFAGGAVGHGGWFRMGLIGGQSWGRILSYPGTYTSNNPSSRWPRGVLPSSSFAFTHQTSCFLRAFKIARKAALSRP
jgi:hypothetical protein